MLSNIHPSHNAPPAGLAGRSSSLPHRHKEGRLSGGCTCTQCLLMLVLLVLCLMLVSMQVVFFASTSKSGCLNDVKEQMITSLSYRSYTGTVNTRNSGTTTGTSQTVVPIAEQLKVWMAQNSHTPGAEFVRLLRTHLHSTPSSEGRRLLACQQRNLYHCYSGKPSSPSDSTSSMPILPNNNNHKTISVETMRHFPGHLDRPISNLGTFPVCLPLYLAAAAVNIQSKNGVLVELGPFVGLSSRCFGAGLWATNNDNDGDQDTVRHASSLSSSRMFVFDTWEGSMNFKSITRSMPWTVKEHPEFTQSHSDFLWLWKEVMKDVYPQAQTIQGFITETSLDPSQWNHRPVALLSIDSIKSWSSWKTQLKGLGDVLLEQGSILCALDFFSSDQPNLIYGCLRYEYLLPVYTSWHRGEHWIFVVTKTIPMDFPAQCMKELLQGQPAPSLVVLKNIQDQLEEDLQFLRNLRPMSPDNNNDQDPPLEEDDNEVASFFSTIRDEMITSMLNSKLATNATKFWSRFQ